jgi:desulfoferrodoxin (superoxide reductase-like protein)
MHNPNSGQNVDADQSRSGLGRRGFLGALGGVAATLSACTVGPTVGTIANPVWVERAAKLKGNTVYTKAVPGMWAGKEGTHVPSVAIDNARVATVSCTHAVAEGHWITTLFIEDQDGNVIHMEEFLGRGPGASQAATSFRVPDSVTSLVAYSYCNLHDCWSSEAIPVA